MKRLLSVIVIVLLLVTGCAKETEEVPETSGDILIAALDEETVPDSETIPGTDPTIPEETRATSGRCVDCGALITDPASFDPYHCAGCGSSEFFYCERCWKFIPCVESIHRMCVDCYWTSGNGEGCCVICGENLDIYVGSGMVCSRCHDLHREMLQPVPQECYLCRTMTASGAYLPNGAFACSRCLNTPNPEGMGRCYTCGQSYKDGEGFEGLCFDCQDKYGPKCSVCGTDCTYRGSIDGMCDDWWVAAQGVPEYVGTCMTCGQPYKDGEGFEGLCYSCQDKYGPKCSVCGADLTYQGGEGGMCYACYEASRMCIVCGSTPGDYDGYCYYCHPNFGYNCSSCGRTWPAHRPEDGLCPDCRDQG